MSKNLILLVLSYKRRESARFARLFFQDTHFESVAMLPVGWSSVVFFTLSKPRSQSSSVVSSEKSASTAPAFVPVTIEGRPAPGDQAKAAVRGISRRRTML